MKEFRMSQVNNEDKPLKGLQDKGVVDFLCEDCGKKLLVLQLTAIPSSTDANILTRVVVKCRDCGGCSYVQQILGQFHPGAPSDSMAFDVLSDADGVPDHDVLFEAWSK